MNINVGFLASMAISIISGGALVSLINAFFQRRKTKAEAESIVAATATSLLVGVNQEMSNLRVRMELVEKQLEEARNKARQAEDEAQKSRLSERELKTEISALGRILDAYRWRVEYLTSCVRQAGITVAPWTVPKGVDLGEAGG
jgi:chromosome segregation ATPase